MEAIKTTSLTKYYGKARGIMALNLTIDKGEFFGFIGPNGAGKSTTIRLLLGLISPTSGNAQILGNDIQKEKQTILQHVGYLPSEAAFYPGMKVKEVLSLSAALRKKNCTKEAQKLCERLELDPSRKVDELSFGNRKKVSIVCALQSTPSLLILDEPFNAIDKKTVRDFRELLSRLNTQEGVTILMTSHHQEDIQGLCKNVYQIDKKNLERIE